MERQLMKERNAFLKKAMETPLEVKKRPQVPPPPEPPKKKVPKTLASDPNAYKTMTGGSQYKFGVLARIVRHMKTRHQDGDTHPLSIDEILDETNQLNAGPKVKHWLVTEALPNNPKVQEVEGKYLFKPPLPVRDRKSLLKLLRQHDMKGHGGVLLDDIQESLPHCDKVMKQLDKEILRVVRQTDKKQIIFYHDKGINFPVEKEFQQLWRNTSVDGLQDDNIEEYLNKQGIKSMQDTGPKVKPIRKKSRKGRTRATKISDNEHMQHVLQTYDDN
ncbi:transcription initiation factor IIE subunit beta-like [Eriocheir sinensis]|uniref:transcription initiation factor IIE subunit beta-like n=1 Tax=Eriocheir sinensis TaxID=95602 RepID=UPI0021CA7D04|nr:transcription initiation factor IIE subunit beta-like [Eriocheir sinensis]XP_050703112.1 transcription initiation factor IIE subunit beta-like [Eriocheir sinensis]XP_050703113.1 transcription initiation factor IIE subunit beta-like [Eriocheir sinensis]